MGSVDRKGLEGYGKVRLPCRGITLWRTQGYDLTARDNREVPLRVIPIF